MKNNMTKSGLTFIEVLLAILIFITLMSCIFQDRALKLGNRVRAAAHKTRLAVTNSSPVSFKYCEFEGRPVFLVCQNDGKGSLYLRISTPPAALRDGSALEFLRSEAVRLTSCTNPVPLGNSGMYLHFQGGYPLWDPYCRIYKGAAIQRLSFAAGATITNNVIEVTGAKVKPEGFYPYPL